MSNNSSAPSTPTKKKIHLEGWLDKQGERGIIKGWKSRFFALSPSGYELHYYEQQPDLFKDQNASGSQSNISVIGSNSLGHIDIRAVTSVKIIDPSAFVISVDVPGRSYILRGKNERDIQYWTQGVNEVISAYQRQKENRLSVSQTSILENALQQKDIELGKLRDMLEQQKSKVKELTINKQKDEVNIQMLNEKVDKLKQDLASKENLIESTRRNSIIANGEEIGKLTSEIAQIKKDQTLIQEKEENIKKLELEIAQLNSQLEITKKQLEEREVLVNKAHELELDIVKKDTLLEEKEKEVAKLNDLSKQRDGEVAEKSKELESVNIKLINLMKQAQEIDLKHQDELDEKDKEIERLMVERLDLKKSITAAGDQELENLKQEYQDKMKSLENDSESEKLKQQERINQLEMELESIKTKHEDDIKSIKSAQQEEISNLSLELELNKNEYQQSLESIKSEENDKLQAIKSKHQEEIDSIRSKFDEEKNSLRAQHEQEIIDNKKQQQSDIEKIKQEYQERIQLLQDGADSLEIMEKQIESIKEQHQSELNSIKEQYQSEVNSIKEQHQSELNSVKEQIESHQSEVNSIKEKHQEEIESIHSKQKEIIQDYQEKVDNLEMEIQTGKLQNQEDLDKELQSLNTKHQQEIESIQLKHREEVDSIRSQADAAKIEYQHSIEELENEKNQYILNSTSQEESVISKVEQLESELSRKNEQWKEEVKKSMSLQDQLYQLENQIKEKDQQLQDEKDNNAKNFALLSSSADANANLIDSLQQQLNQLREDNSILSTESQHKSNDHKELIQSLKSQLEQANIDIEALQQQLEQSKTQHENLQKTHEELLEDHEKLRIESSEQVDSLKEAINIGRVNQEDSSTKWDAIVRDLEQAQHTIAQLTKQLQEKQMELLEREELNNSFNRELLAIGREDETMLQKITELESIVEQSTGIRQLLDDANTREKELQERIQMMDQNYKQLIQEKELIYNTVEQQNKNHISILQNQIESLQQQLTEQQQQNSNNISIVSPPPATSDEGSNSQVSNIPLKDSIGEAMHFTSELEKELEESDNKAELAKTLTLLDVKTQEFEEKVQELTECQRLLDSTQEQLSKSKQHLDESTRKYHALEKERNQLADKCKQLDIEYYEMKDKIMVLEEEIQSLKQNDKESSIVVVLKERYFLTVARSLKLQCAQLGYACNRNVYEMYEQAIKENIHMDEWPVWISKQLEL